MTKIQQIILSRKLEILKTQLKTISEELDISAGFGDLSENQEYEVSKRKLEDISYEIISLEKRLEEDVKEFKTRCIEEGSLIRLNIKSKSFICLVGEEGSPSFDGTLSSNSPIGKAILGQKPGPFSISNGIKTEIFSVSLATKEESEMYLNKFLDGDIMKNLFNSAYA